jgi:hypothetical protein
VVALIVLGFGLRTMQDAAKKMNAEDMFLGMRPRVRSASNVHREALSPGQRMSAGDTSTRVVPFGSE